MNRSRLQPDRERSSRRARPSFEPLEGRALLSTSTTAHARADAKAAATPPAANQPPANTKRSYPPYNISLEIYSGSDPAGDGYVFQKNIFVDGYSVPYSTVWLAEGTRPGYFTDVTQADYSGHYSFLISVPRGGTQIRTFAENSGQDYSNIAEVTAYRSNAVVAWDAIALRAIRNLQVPATEASRDLALLSAAQYDAVANIADPGHVYQVKATPPKGASAQAAANSAAQTVLDALFPSQYIAFLGAYDAAVAGLPAGQATKQGLNFGREVGNQTLTDHADDGSINLGTLTPSAVPGQWRPTPPEYTPAITPGWGQVTPFVLSSGSEFRPPAPPSLDSATYDQALQQVASLGALGSTTRTAAQSDAAQFWNDGPGTFTNPGHWNEIADQVAVDHQDTLMQDARIFAQLNFALADTAIATTDAQTTYDLWRPITAIQQTNPSFLPFLVTPASPSYPSDNAAYGAAAAEVLNAAFGAKTSFTDDLYAQFGTVMNFPSFDAAATQDANSRVYGGVNFSFDVTAGTTLGDQVGQAVLKQFPGK